MLRCTDCGRANYQNLSSCPACGGTAIAAESPRVSRTAFVKGFRNRPGTALARIIPKWAASQKKGCGCKDYQKKMDLWGTEGCEVQFDNIVSHLLKQEKHLISPLRVLPDALKKKFAQVLVARAIARSRQD